MTLEKYTQDELRELSMVEIAYEILAEKNEAMNFNDVFELIAEAKQFTAEEKDRFIAQFYTDLNIDGRFLTVGTNTWGLKKWYPYEQQEDDTISFNDEVPKKKKKKKKKKKAEVEEEALEEDDLLEDDLAEADEDDDDFGEDDELFEDDDEYIEADDNEDDDEEDL